MYVVCVPNIVRMFKKLSEGRGGAFIYEVADVGIGQLKQKFGDAFD